MRPRPSRAAITTTTIAIALCLLLVALAGCGDVGGVAIRNVAPSPTVNTKGATTPSASMTPTPEVLPYTFASAWQMAPNPFASRGQLAFAFAPSNQQIGYACGSHSQPFAVTTDGGASWRVGRQTPFTTCGPIFIDGNDPADVFVSQNIPYPGNPVQSEDQLWRSRDSGATWQKLGMVDGQHLPLGWSNLAVVGTRIIGSVFVNGEGGLNNPLFYSDDGGMTWRQLAQSIADQQHALGEFVVAGDTIYISGMYSQGAAGYAGWPTAHGQRPTRSGAPPHVGFSGSPSGAEQYWRSTDGGDTWSPVWTALTLPSGLPTFVRAANGAGYYAVAITKQTSNNNGNTQDATLSWNSDGGGSWTPLPDLRGLEGGYVLGGGYENTIAPDGSIFAVAEHSQSGYGDDAGVFVIHPTSAAPAWIPLAPGGLQDLQATMRGAGVRLWAENSTATDQALQYVDVA